jgi:hypothetical protein
MCFCPNQRIPYLFSFGLVKCFTQNFIHHPTNSTLNENQLKTLYDYLNKHKNEDDGQILTLYDQMPVRLSQEEINQLMNELDKIKNWFHE